MWDGCRWQQLCQIEKCLKRDQKSQGVCLIHYREQQESQIKSPKKKHQPDVKSKSSNEKKSSHIHRTVISTRSKRLKSNSKCPSAARKKSSDQCPSSVLGSLNDSSQVTSEGTVQQPCSESWFTGAFDSFVQLSDTEPNRSDGEINDKTSSVNSIGKSSNERSHLVSRRS